MNMYDIKSEEEWQQILDDLCEELEMPSALVDPASFVLQESGERHAICTAIRSNQESLIGICAQTQKLLSRQAKETKRPVILGCEVSMSKCLIPLLPNGEFVGSVVVCGTAIPGEPMKASEIAKWTDLSEEEINRMSQEVPEVDKKRVAEVANRLFEKIHSDL